MKIKLDKEGQIDFVDTLWQLNSTNIVEKWKSQRNFLFALANYLWHHALIGMTEAEREEIRRAAISSAIEKMERDGF